MKCVLTPPGISIILPCLNEAETIERAVQQAINGLHLSGFSGEVIVADTGSIDGSPQIASKAGATVISIDKRGYGTALNGGILAAQYPYIIFCDSDLSYPFEAISTFIHPVIQNRADFILGNRLNSMTDPRAMPFLNRWWGTPILSLAIRLLYGLNTKDCNSGMRAFKKSDYLALGLTCPGMEFASEMLIRVAQLKMNYLEIPIQYRKDGRTRRPHLNRWRDGWRHLRIIIGLAPTKLVVELPLAIGMTFYLLAFCLSSIPVVTSLFTLFGTMFFFLVLSIILIKSALIQIKKTEGLHLTPPSKRLG